MSMEVWKVTVDYYRSNVYEVWNEEMNFHDDTSVKARDNRARLISTAPQGYELAKMVVEHCVATHAAHLCHIIPCILARQIIAKVEKP